MQIAGSTCEICHRTLVLSSEGKFCSRCRIIVHRACESQTECHVCGQPFQDFEPSVIDPIEEAVIPRGLRDVNTGMGVALLVAGVAGLIVILFCGLFYILSHGQ
jgi:hypothetical protein